LSDSIILIPTYNEKENIAKIIHKVFSLPKKFHVLIIDDGSPDGTADIVKNLIEEQYTDCLFIEERAGKMGLGTAYIYGFKWALKQKYEYVFEMDADFSHNPDDLIALYQACANEGADMSVGSRYIDGGGVINWPKNRVLLSKYASVYVRLITWMPVYDTTAGFVCYTRKVLQTINLEKIQFVGYAFQIEMKFATWMLGFTIKEVPIIFTDRIAGESKMHKSIITEAVKGVVVMKWQSFFKNYGK
jgi:dolichol-phosphate mannosyltransferase